MAQRQPDDEDDTLELTPDMEADADEGPDDESDEGGEGEEERDSPDEGDETEAPGFVEDGEAADEGDNTVLRRMRERINELGKENADLRRAQPPPVEETLPPEPTLADFDYDEDAFKGGWREWNQKAQKIADAKAAREREAEAANREWQKDLERFEEKRLELKLPDFAGAAETVKAQLSLPQQAVIIKAATNPAAFIYALGHSDTRLAEVAKIADPIKLAAAVARMEGGVKVVKRRKTPAPDKPARGTAQLPGGVDKQLEKLQAEADRTGDRTAIIAYKKKLEQRAKK